MLPSSVAQGYVNQFDELAVLDTKLISNSKGTAIAIKKDNQDLVDKVNSTITRLQENGDIERFIAEATALAENSME